MTVDERDYAAFMQRLSTFEERLDSLEYMLNDMREIFSQAYDVLSKANDNRRQSFDVFNERVTRDFRRVGEALNDQGVLLEDLTKKLNSTYEAVFPGQMRR